MVAEIMSRADRLARTAVSPAESAILLALRP